MWAVVDRIPIFYLFFHIRKTIDVKKILPVSYEVAVVKPFQNLRHAIKESYKISYLSGYKILSDKQLEFREIQFKENVIKYLTT